MSTTGLLTLGERYWLPVYRPRALVLERGPGCRAGDTHGREYPDFGARRPATAAPPCAVLAQARTRRENRHSAPLPGYAMRYLHTMIRVRDLDAALKFFCQGLGLHEVRRMDNEAGKFTLVFLAAEGSPQAEIELTHNWGSDEDYGSARNFGHLAFEVEDIYASCAHLAALGVTINRPPRDGHMAFVRSPDLISIELLQKGARLPPAEPWASMPNTGVW